ncbi:cox2 cytochrome oxidase subunit 2 [Ectopseudomonas oleovorans]|nr:cox2 cytochrome oxidase subunit 2 [Pseudomonas oleovorans]
MGLRHWSLALLGGSSLALTPLTSVMAEEEMQFTGFYENATFVRDSAGLSKFRNTVQVNADKKFGTLGQLNFNNVAFHGTFRGTYDGVYDLNSSEYGSGAGGAVNLENNIAGAGSTVPHGGGIRPPGTFFGFNDARNPNEGMIVLGENLHKTRGGVAFGVPVRPCDKDSRGCIDDYLDYSSNDLRFPEFNERLDFIRELYVDFDNDLPNGDILSWRLGKQQVIWGRTDLFRVLDVINPVDFSRNNIYDELEDIRIPMWIAKADWRMGAGEVFDDLNLSFVWNFDKFRPHNLGQCGQPNSILDAGCFFRGMNNLWENGGTVANFAGGNIATDFGPGQIGIRKAHMPSWSLSNSQFGIKLEGVYGDFGFSLNALTYRSQLPSLRGGIPAQNAFTGETAVWPGLIAFDIHFPRVNLIGGSMDYYSQAIDTVFRFEVAHTEGEEFANTLQSRLFSESDVTRYVIGADKNIFIPFLNPGRAFLFSGQLFGQHIHEHQLEDRPLGKAGMPDWEQNWIGTLLVKGWWMNDRLSPQIIVAHDFKAQATAIAPSVEYLFSDNLKIVAGANLKVGRGAREFDDCRSCNPWDPFTSYGLPEGVSAGLSGYEPLGRFRAGPIGMAQKEDELQLTLRYSF